MEPSLITRPCRVRPSTFLNRTVHFSAILPLLIILSANAFAAVSIYSSSFESPAVGAGQFQYPPIANASWIFEGSSGLAGNNSGFTNGPSAVAEAGVQVAFIQGTAAFSQTISGFTAEDICTISFSAAQRNYGPQVGETWSVTVDGISIADFAPPQSATQYMHYFATFTATKGAHSIGFRGTNARGGDNTVLIDYVDVSVVSGPPIAPSGLVVAPISDTQSTLAWIDNSRTELNYNIERKTLPAGTYVLLDTVPANTKIYEDRSLSPGSSYSYRVNASNYVGVSAYSNEWNVTASVQSIPTNDFAGNPVIKTPAPTLTFIRQTAPRVNGIDYAFPEQTAEGVALLSRFPSFSLSDRTVHVDGPWYASPGANLHFSRGISTIGAWPNYRLHDSDPTTVRKLPMARKHNLWNDDIFWNAAASLADSLESQNASDSRIAPLRTFSTEHVFVNDEAAFTALGRTMYNSERGPVDFNFEGVLFPCLDIESTGGWEFQRNCFGWIYKGMAAIANEIGHPFHPLLYGQYQYDVGCFDNSNRQGGVATAAPDYLRDTNDFLSVADPTLQVTDDNGGILSMDGYMQAMWGQNEPFYKRNTDGTLKLSGGLPVFNEVTSTTAFGHSLIIEPGEAKQCLDNLYRQAVRMYIQHHRRAGQYPSNSTLRKPFLTNTVIGAWSRFTNEGLLGIEQNDRPLPSWLLEMLTGIYLMTADDIMLWSSDTNFVPGALGANYRTAWQYNAHGVLESVVKAAHRYSALDRLHDGSPFKWCWFSLPVIHQNTTTPDRYFEKPLAIGKIYIFEGKPWLELFAAFPALDNTSATFSVWVNQNGTRSKTYTFTIPNGRSYFLDAWQLPTNFSNLEGKDIYLRFNDLLGTRHTWHGDWRTTVNNNSSAPSAYSPPAVTGFALWQQQKFGALAGSDSSLLNADPDGDGLSNLAEYTLSTDPSSADQSQLPKPGIVEIAGNSYLTITFTHLTTASDAIATVQTSDYGSAWSDGSRYGAGGDVANNANTTQVNRSGSPVETITVRDNTPASPKTQRMMRISIALP